MLGRGIIAGLQTGPISFVGFGNGSGTTVSKPADVRTGDLILVAANNVPSQTVSTASGAVWGQFNLAHSVTSTSIWWKFLSASDLAGAWNWSSSVQYARMQYRAAGATTLTVKSDGTTKGSGSQASFAGFTPSVLSRGVLALVTQSFGGSFISYPAGFDGRFNTNTSLQNGVIVATSHADQVQGYAGGSIDFTHGSPPTWGMIVAEVT